MSCVIDMSLPRLIEQGKGDPGEITDLLLAGGYSRAFTLAEMVRATTEVCRTWRSLELPYGQEPETPEQVMGCYLNQIVDEAMQKTDSTSASVAAAVIAAGFAKVANHE
ncbi:MAG: hypothetical protein E7D73_23150 [Klebsiella sp.]|uniref:hypothetical protein n=1 Tax=Klebsiella pneumoniae complex TaxID=3390273 RepID=UPI000C7CB6F5|nr:MULTISPECIES: hypothetical protein [Klebsiella]MDU2306858.1 hypothetical protein [Klebsiella sp.]PLE80037.1 hypothetical protein B6I80_19660 [Klebsiella pneumoniae]HBQ7825088.1 hypothetical protein [Klebsiella pneumoniae]HCA9948953.1 hypothetical protein [Klebsiella variicola subsp. variicola]